MCADRVALIDADVLAYRAAWAAQTDVNWGDGDITSDTDLDLVRTKVSSVVEEWTKLVKCDRAILVQSDPARASFRHAVHPHYKQQRTKTKKPLGLKDAEAFIREKFETRMIKGLEGDDTLGLMATKKPDECVVVSTDKDMLTLPVRVCIIPHARGATEARKYHLTEADANRNWMTQAIVGDTSDNYSGAPGMGAVAAEGFLCGLVSENALWAGVIDAFQESWDERKRFRHKWVHPGDIITEATMNVRCARILRHGDLDGRRVKLWAPPGHPPVWASIDTGGIE